MKYVIGIAAVVAALVVGVVVARAEGVRLPWTVVAADPYLCHVGHSPSQPVGSSGSAARRAFTSAFTVATGQHRVMLRVVECDRYVQTVRYVAPNRLQYSGFANHEVSHPDRWNIVRGPTTTQIGSQVNNGGDIRFQPWPGAAAAFEEALLRSFRRGPYSGTRGEHILRALTFWVSVPKHGDSADKLKDIVITLSGRGVDPSVLCAPFGGCPHFGRSYLHAVRYLAQLRVDRTTGLPLSYASWVARPFHGPGRIPYRPLLEVLFSYNRTFTIRFTPA